MIKGFKSKLENLYQCENEGSKLAKICQRLKWMIPMRSMSQLDLNDLLSKSIVLMLERQVLAWGSFSKVGFYGKIWLKYDFYFTIKHLFKTIKVKLIFGQNFDISAIVYCCYRQPNWNTGNLLGNTLEALNFLKIGLYFFLKNKLNYIFEK